MNLIKWISLVFHTLRYYKASQLLYRVTRTARFGNPNLIGRGKRCGMRLCSFPIRGAAKIIGKKISLLNETADISHRIWMEKNRSDLWVYNLHYFDDLNRVDSTSRFETHCQLITSWLQDYQFDRDRPGWHSYPTSKRIINWIKWDIRFSALSQEALDSLVLQAHLLSHRLERDLMANHLFVNGKALAFAGVYLDGRDAERWLKIGLSILEEQLTEQVLKDGGHFERSPMYHADFVEDILDLINLLRCYKSSALAKDIEACVLDMLEWLQIMSHPDGQISFFNDATFEVAATIESLLGYATQLGFKPLCEWSGSRYLKESGYCRLENKRAVLLCDIAPVGPSYQAGHAHADTLSFELSVDGFRVFVNSGVSEYGVTPERLRQRGTAAHNTLELDHSNSSEVWSGFRVARRAFPFGISVEINNPWFQTVTASHDGYKRLRGKPVHTRKWTLTEEVLSIKDNIDGPFSSAISHFHLHPEVSAELLDDTITIYLPNGHALELTTAGGIAQLEQSTWHPGFGKVIPSQKISIFMHKSKLVTNLQFTRIERQIRDP